MTERAPKQFVSIWLRKNSSPRHILFCPDCQYPLMKYRGALVSIVPGDGGVKDNGDASEEMVNPVEIQCKGDSPIWGKCNAMYIVGWTQ